MTLELVKCETADSAVWQIDMLLKQLAQNIEAINPVWLDECRWKINSLCYRTGLHNDPAKEILTMGHLVRSMIETPPQKFEGMKFEYDKEVIDAPRTLEIMAEKLHLLSIKLQNRRAS